ncbi:hypothetical protein [Stomatohabitans albus]|uniref:hypothetical protein n=1 Tax=Stomatohabitans albus TaxID=3110766 RepID=UPI00300CE46A
MGKNNKNLTELTYEKGISKFCNYLTSYGEHIRSDNKDGFSEGISNESLVDIAHLCFIGEDRSNLKYLVNENFIMWKSILLNARRCVSNFLQYVRNRKSEKWEEYENRSNLIINKNFRFSRIGKKKLDGLDYCKTLNSIGLYLEEEAIGKLSSINSYSDEESKEIFLRIREFRLHLESFVESGNEEELKIIIMVLLSLEDKFDPYESSYNTHVLSVMGMFFSCILYLYLKLSVVKFQDVDGSIYISYYILLALFITLIILSTIFNYNSLLKIDFDIEHKRLSSIVYINDKIINWLYTLVGASSVVGYIVIINSLDVSVFAIATLALFDVVLLMIIIFVIVFYMREMAEVQKSLESYYNT